MHKLDTVDNLSFSHYSIPHLLIPPNPNSTAEFTPKLNLKLTGMDMMGVSAGSVSLVVDSPVLGAAIQFREDVEMKEN